MPIAEKFREGRPGPKKGAGVAEASDLGQVLDALTPSPELDDPPITHELEDLAADIDAACRIRGTFVLRSGTVTDEYFDKYRFEGDSALLRRVAEAVVPLLPTDTEVLGGFELGGVPIATVVSSLTGLPAVFVRNGRGRPGRRRVERVEQAPTRRPALVEGVEPLTDRSPLADRLPR